MADNDTNEIPPYAQPAEPSADLKHLDRLVGIWAMSGGVQGTVTYEWMEGGFFLIQHVDLQHEGAPPIRGIEILGHLRPFGQGPSPEIWSRYYGNTGETLDYVYELNGDTLTIWAGGPGSPAYYQGTLSGDGNTLTGAWHFPGGGGYEATATRLS